MQNIRKIIKIIMFSFDVLLRLLDSYLFFYENLSTMFIYIIPDI